MLKIEKDAGDTGRREDSEKGVWWKGKTASKGAGGREQEENG